MRKIFTLALAAMMTAGLTAQTPATLQWNGAAGDSLWNETSVNWMEGEMATPWVDGSSVYIAPDSLGAVQRYIRLNDSVNVAGFTFESDQNYSIVADSTDAGVHSAGQFIKKGSGNLTLKGQDFWFWFDKGSVLEAGTVTVSGPAASSNNIEEQVLGPQVTLKNGATLTFAAGTTDKHGYENITTDIIVEDDAEATVIFDRNLVYSGKVIGGKTSVLNLGDQYLREHFMCDWIDFEGTVKPFVSNPLDKSGAANFIFCDTLGIAEWDVNGNLVDVYRRDAYTIDSAKVKDEGYTYTTRVAYGFPKAKVVLGDNAYFYAGGNMSASVAQNAYPSNDKNVMRIGALAGSASSVLGAGCQQRGSYEANYFIGGLNTNEVFEGVINNTGYKKTAKATNIYKEGTGDWRLTNSKLSNNGSYNVRAGSLTILGQATTNGTVSVSKGAALKGNPVFTAASIATIDGILEPGDSTINNSIGAIQFQNANVNFGENAHLKIGLGQGRCDQIVYYGETTFDGNATIEFFVEENTVKAGDQFRILVPYNEATNSNATLQGECKIVCQEGLEIDYSNLFNDPQWAEGADKSICGTITVISNTASGKYGSAVAAIKSVNPVDGSYVGTSGSIVLTFDKTVLRGTGDITMGGKVFEPVIDDKTVTINFSGLSNEAVSYDLVIPEGALLDAYDNKPTAAFKANYLLDNVAPVLSNSSLADAAEISWADGSVTLTYSENVKVAGQASINQTQFEKIIASASGAVVTLSYYGLNFETDYTLTVPQGAITDAYGNPAEAFSVSFKTQGYDKTLVDSVALNGKPNTTLPIEEKPLSEGNTNTYPLWCQYKEGSFADGAVTWTSSNTGNKLMAAFVGDAQALYVWAKATGKDMLLAVQESPAEAGVVTWRTIRVIDDWDLGENERCFAFALTPGCRFIKIKPVKASSTSSIIVTGYKVDNKPVALEDAVESKLQAMQVNGGLMLRGLNAGNKVEVFNLSGRRVAMMQASGDELFVPAQGFVLVKVTGDNSTEVLKAIAK